MTKNLLAFTAAALFSLNASAGYVEYTFDGPLNGVFAQNTDNKSIADYFFRINSSSINAQFQVNVPNGSEITGVSTRFRGAGPTNFSIIDRNSMSSIYELAFTFWESDVAGRYNYLASYSQRPDGFYPPVPEARPIERLNATFFGFAYENPARVSPTIYTSPEGKQFYGNMLPVLIPSASLVPEPGTLALVTLGVFAAGSLRRRRESQG